MSSSIFKVIIAGNKQLNYKSVEHIIVRTIYSKCLPVIIRLADRCKIQLKFLL